MPRHLRLSGYTPKVTQRRGGPGGKGMPAPFTPLPSGATCTPTANRHLCPGPHIPHPIPLLQSSPGQKAEPPAPAQRGIPYPRADSGALRGAGRAHLTLRASPAARRAGTTAETAAAAEQALEREQEPRAAAAPRHAFSSFIGWRGGEGRGCGTSDQ